MDNAKRYIVPWDRNSVLQIRAAPGHIAFPVHTFTARQLLAPSTSFFVHPKLYTPSSMENFPFFRRSYEAPTISIARSTFFCAPTLASTGASIPSPLPEVFPVANVTEFEWTFVSGGAPVWATHKIMPYIRHQGLYNVWNNIPAL